MLALADYEAHVCDCGFHESEADQDPDLALEFRVCPVCSGMAKSLRMIAAADETAVRELGDKPPPEAQRPEDGRYPLLRRKIPAELQRLLDAQAAG